ncbi:hypothetical protein M8J77_003467 [Diaphorina citri]|nr:hypothetical protein M8J77_003467 [Diaphorina citri]
MSHQTKMKEPIRLQEILTLLQLRRNQEERQYWKKTMAHVLLGKNNEASRENNGKTDPERKLKRKDEDVRHLGLMKYDGKLEA